MYNLADIADMNDMCPGSLPHTQHALQAVFQCCTGCLQVGIRAGSRSLMQAVQGPTWQSGAAPASWLTQGWLPRGPGRCPAGPSPGAGFRPY